MVDVDETFTRKRFPKNSLFDVDDVARKFDEMKVDKNDKRSKSRTDKKSRKVVKREQVWKN